jgi:Na+/H+-dicarboxylate symporter
MKVWMKFLLGVALGVVAALVLPVNSPAVVKGLEYLSGLTVRVGRYIVLPLVFFSIAGGVYALHDTKRLYKPLGIILLTIVFSSLLLTFVGLFSILFFTPPHIPISGETVTEIVSLDAKTLIGDLFPFSSFETLLNGSFLLPALVFAFLIGSACALDKPGTKPVVALVQSLSTVFEHISGFLMDFLAIGMAAVSCFWTISFFPILTSGVYTTLVLVLTIDFLAIVFVIYPLFVSFFCRGKGRHPFRVVFASLAPIVAAFFSGDTNFTLPITMKQSKEMLNIGGSLNALSNTLFSAFARGGAALTSAVAFVIILHSYSALDISFDNILWIAGCAFAFSFLLPGLPSGGAFVLLTMLCARYGRGYEAGYLLLKPAALIVCSFAAALDAATAVFGTCIVALKLNITEYKTI